jgi:WD40 repeat protein
VDTSAGRAWTVVKLFVSSTFQDMQAERDHLVRIVFPRLRADLTAQRIHLVDVDLRWGVTSEANVQSFCREVIDECLPHFIGVLGSRYGWVPDGEQISITHQEIRYVLQSPGRGRPHAFFYFRDAAALETLPEATRRRYSEVPSGRFANLLDGLRREVTAAGHVPRSYGCRWDNQGQQFVDLDAFGDLVHRDLIDSVRLSTGRFAPEAAASEFQEARRATDEFIESRTQHYVAGGREKVLSALERRCRNPSDERAMCVVGPSGSGKSALLARFCRRLISASEDPSIKPVKLIPIFVGAGDAASTDARRLLRRLVWELADGAEDVPQASEALQEQLATLMNIPMDQTVVVVFDAIDQLDSADQHLAWLPVSLPINMRMIFSATPGPALDALRGRQVAPLELSLEPLEMSVAATMCRDFLWTYRKKLEPRQQAALLAKEEAGQPLYLVAVLEELRTLGTYEEIDRRINELPGRTADLFAWILTRLERDQIFGLELVSSFFRFLTAGREGVRMEDLIDLVAPGDSSGRLAALARLVRPYLTQRGPSVSFFHRAVREAATRRYLSNAVALAATHRTLADHFQRVADPNRAERWDGDPRGLQEVAYHLTRLNAFAELQRLYFNVDFLSAFCAGVAVTPGDRGTEHGGSAILLSSLIEMLRLLRSGDVASDTTVEIERLARLFAFEDRLLQRVPDALFNELVNRDEYGGTELPRPLILAARQRCGHGLRTAPFFEAQPVAKGHSSRVTTASIAHDGTRVVTGSADGTVAVWYANRPAPLWFRNAHKSWVTSCALSPNGTRAVTAGDDGSLYLWDVDIGVRQPLHTWWRREGAIVWPPVAFCAFAGDDIVYAVSTGWLRTFDLRRACVIRACRVPSTGRLVSSVESPEVCLAADRIAVLAGSEEVVAVVDVASGSVLTTVKLSGEANRLALSEDGRTLVASDHQGRLTLIDLSHESKREFRDRPFRTLCSAGDCFFATTIDNEITRFTAAQPKNVQRARLTRGADRVTALAASANDGTVVAGRESGAIEFIDALSLQRKESRPAASSVLRGAFFNRGQMLVALEGSKSADQDDSSSTVAVVDVIAKTHRTLGAHRGFVTGAAAIGATRALTVDNSGDAVMWINESPRVVASMPDLSFTACAEWQGHETGIAGTADERVVVLGQEREITTLHSNSLAFRAGISALAAAGRQLNVFATYFNGLVRFHGPNADWSGREDTRHSLRGTAVALDTEARHAASGNLNGELQLWRCSDGHLLREVRLHDGEIVALAFSPNGKFVFSSGADGLLFVLELANQQVVSGAVLPSCAVSLQMDSDDFGRILLRNGDGLVVNLTPRAQS